MSVTKPTLKNLIISQKEKEESSGTFHIKIILRMNPMSRYSFKNRVPMKLIGFLVITFVLLSIVCLFFGKVNNYR